MGTGSYNQIKPEEQNGRNKKGKPEKNKIQIRLGY